MRRIGFRSSHLHDRFLNYRSQTRAGARLGRVFSVIEQTWALSDDPKKVRPNETALATHRTAAEAADLARDAADRFRAHGFHKPSGAWWGADDGKFHRFLVAPDRRARAGQMALGLGAAVLALAAIGAAWRDRRSA
jgi:hypothetical protein